MKKYTIGTNGFECKDGDSINVTEILKGNILEVKRYDCELDGKKVQHLVVNMQNSEFYDLIFKYTSIESRNFMNILAAMNEEEIACGKNCKIFFLSDRNENGKVTNIRLEHEGRHIKWLYPKPPDNEIVNGEYKRDSFWDNVYEDIKGVWCDKS
jgi:hypothetical protein